MTTDPVEEFVDGYSANDIFSSPHQRSGVTFGDTIILPGEIKFGIERKSIFHFPHFSLFSPFLYDFSLFLSLCVCSSLHLSCAVDIVITVEQHSILTEPPLTLFQFCLFIFCFYIL